MGTKKTYMRIASDYSWPECYHDVTDFVKRCEVCQACKVDQKASPRFLGQRIVQQPWIVVAADIMGPFFPHRNGFEYVLVLQDLFTNWVECIPLRSAASKRICDAFHELIINRWGTRQVLLTNNRTEFINNTIRSLAQEFNIFHTTTAPYHPQANLVERFNRVLKTIMIFIITKDHRLWDKHLSKLRSAYNTAYHSTLKATSAFLNLGREPKQISSMRRRK